MKKFLKFLLRKIMPSVSRSHQRPRQLVVQKVKPQNALRASQLVTEYRENGFGSNRADWARMTALLAAVETAIETNSAVDITELFPADASDKQYHTAHRALSAGIIRPLWHKVAIVVLSDAKVRGHIATGESTTTGKGKVFVVPVIGDAEVPALV